MGSVRPQDLRNSALGQGISSQILQRASSYNQ
jgi:hypothetical protein